MNDDEMLGLRDRLHDSPPKFMEGVIATAIGHKVIAGSPTPLSSLQFIVPAKRPSRDVVRAQRIPARIDGHPTDVLALGGEMTLTDHSAPAESSGIGCGAPLISSRGEFATIGCVAGEVPHFITAAHVIRTGENAFLDVPERPLIGACVKSFEVATGSQLYANRARNPQEQFAIDIAAIRVATGVPAKGGLPGNQSFTLFFESIQLATVLKGAQALSLGAATRGWRTGVIAGVWPRPVGVNVTGYCLIQHTPLSLLGDSGSMWLGRSAKGFLALGLHRSLVPGSTAPYAFVTDLAAGLRFLGLGSLWGDGTAADVTDVNALRTTAARQGIG
jgi:hypothetical protein